MTVGSVRVYSVRCLGFRIPNAESCAGYYEAR